MKVLQANCSDLSLTNQRLEHAVEMLKTELASNRKQLIQASEAMEIETQSAFDSGQQVLRWQNDAAEAHKQEERWRVKATQAKIENEALERALQQVTAVDADRLHVNTSKGKEAIAKAESLSREIGELRQWIEAEAMQKETGSLTLDGQEQDDRHNEEVCHLKAALCRQVEDTTKAKQELQRTTEKLADSQKEVEALREHEKGLSSELRQASAEHRNIEMLSLYGTRQVEDPSTQPQALPSRFDAASRPGAWAPRRGSRDIRDPPTFG